MLCFDIVEFADSDWKPVGDYLDIFLPAAPPFDQLAGSVPGHVRFAGGRGGHTIQHHPVHDALLVIPQHTLPSAWLFRYPTVYVVDSQPLCNLGRSFLRRVPATHLPN